MPTLSNASLGTRCIGALLFCVASVGSAHAQDELNEAPETTLSETPQGPQLSAEEADKKARSLFEQGRVAFQDGHYRDAWDYFRKAYLLSKRPELLYNVGQSADRMRMDREALEAFRLYLKRLPDAQNRREVENRVRALEERLREAGTPAGAAPNGGPPERPETSNPEAAPGGSLFGSTEPPTPPPPSNGQPTRTGFYLRLALGLGLLSDSISGGGFDSTLSSVTSAAELGLGYDVDQGIVIGGGLFFDWSLSPGLHSGSSKTDVDSANLSMLEAFIDYYFAPRKDGWHLLGALGVASLTVHDPSGMVSSQSAGGVALIGGGGYEWPLDREWALGVLGRLTLVRLSQGTRNHTTFAPSVACTVAWY
jgi:hypothetical protein